MENKIGKVATETFTAQKFWVSEDKKYIFLYKKQKRGRNYRWTLVGFDEKTHNDFYFSSQDSDVTNVLSTNSFFIKLNSEN